MRIRVRGVDAAGEVRLETDLPHGQGPVEVLSESGWDSVELEQVVHDVPAGLVTTVHRVRPAAAPTSGTAPAPVRSEVSAAEAASAVVKQRLSAYAVVRSARGVLLAQASTRTSSDGWWGLPGGGVDDGESLAEATAREVWEETGQQVQVAHPIAVLSDHWIGRAPNGVVEDFHSVKVVHLASCPAPRDAVLHDVGGTTAASAWVPAQEMARLPIMPWVRPLLAVPDAPG
ncbi:NUDIX hydrolase [Dermacoccaceae bacterium W4C1]